MKDFVPEDHLAHFIREVVRKDLGLSALLSTYQESRGQPPYHPALMVALVQPRRLLLAQDRAACEERVDFMAVTG